MNPITILWADDEIDLLKPHIMFLRSKGYDPVTVNNGRDALELVGSRHFDLVILDENMPGLTGLETLQRIKEIAPQTPVIMITKSEEENIMDQAVGNNIADYLIKPVNPNQILLSIKKNLHSDALVSQTTATDYSQEFSRLSGLINGASTIKDFYTVYEKLVNWELRLASADTNMDEMLKMQKTDADAFFYKFVKRNYENWVTAIPSANGKAISSHTDPDRPMLSPEVFRNTVFPILDKGEKLFFVLIDNFRLDLWLTVKPLLAEYFTFDEQLYTSILPTATQYARNSIFSGLMPIDIARLFPHLWVDEDEEEGKNLNESELVQTLFERYRRQCKFSYNKINDSTGSERLVREFANLAGNDLNVIVLNFTTYAAPESPAFNVELAKLYEANKAKGLEIYQVAIDDDEFSWREAANNLPWITVYNSPKDGATNLLRYNVKSLPALFIINRNGELVERVETVGQLPSAVSRYL